MPLSQKFLVKLLEINFVIILGIQLPENTSKTRVFFSMLLPDQLYNRDVSPFAATHKAFQMLALEQNRAGEGVHVDQRQCIYRLCPLFWFPID